MEKKQEEPAYYEGTPSTVISARVPVPIKIQLMELAMQYKLSQGEYIGYLVSKITSDPERFDPKKVEKLSNSLNDLQSKLEEVEKELDETREEGEKAVKAWKAAVEAVSNLTVENEGLNKQIEALEDDKKRLTEHYEGKRKNLSQSSQKRVSEVSEQLKAEQKKANDLKARLDKANARLKEENITDGKYLGSGKVVQF